MTIILQSEDIKKCVELNEQLIPVIEDAFKNLAQGKTTMPPILRLDIEKYHGESDVKAHDSILLYVAAKMIRFVTCCLLSFVSLIVHLNTSIHYPKLPTNLAP